MLMIGRAALAATPCEGAGDAGRHGMRHAARDGGATAVTPRSAPLSPPRPHRRQTLDVYGAIQPAVIPRNILHRLCIMIITFGSPQIALRSGVPTRPKIVNYIDRKQTILLFLPTCMLQLNS